MKRPFHAAALSALSLIGATCLLPAEERVALDREVGRSDVDGVTVRVAGGLAAVRSFDGRRLELWAQAPRLRVTVDLPEGEERAVQIDVLNCMLTATLRVNGGPTAAPSPSPGRAASCRFETTLTGANTLDVFPSSEDPQRPFVFAVMSDVQSAVDRVQDIFERMNEDPELEFVVSTGDLVDTGKRSELERFQDELATLEIPFFSTVGNHEMGAPPSVWHELFGLFNVHFRFGGVAFSLVDSGNATIDPGMYERLDGWLDEDRDRHHIVLTHVPPLDPSGLRGGGFRSRKEAAKLLAKLAQGRVDALFLGHIHSYYAFSSAGVPTYISGGGGAIQEKLDGIERHYLRVRVDPERGIEDVAIVRID
jgi:predicted phosphodiesterase